MSNSRQQRYFLPALTGGAWGWVFLLAFTLCACSEDDNENNGNGGGNGSNIHNTSYTVTSQSEPPVWQMDWSGDQQRPNWQEPNPSLYANWTLLNVQIEEELEDYVTKDDLLALFVGDELRGCIGPEIFMGTDIVNPSFEITAYGNETDADGTNVTLQYYCHKLKQIFTAQATIYFSLDESPGGKVEFTRGSAKYPVVTTVNVDAFLEKADIIPIGGNIIGAFVGDECRGHVTLSELGSTRLVVYGRNAGESVTLKYYDALTEQLFTIADAIKMPF